MSQTVFEKLQLADEKNLLIQQMVASANQKLAMLDVSLVKPVGKAHLGTGDMEFF